MKNKNNTERNGEKGIAEHIAKLIILFEPQI